ncbi:MAG: flippase [Candidatus Kuenenbacteria bacterium]
MSLTKKIALNTALHTLGKFGASFIGIFVVAILTRYLGIEGYGRYTTIFAYLFFFAILSDLGLYVVTVNELGRSKYGEEKFFNNIFTMRFITALILMIIASALVWIFPYSLIIKLGVIVASFSIFLNLLDQLIVAFFQNKINMKRVAIAELIGKLVLLGITVFFVYLKLNLIWLIIAIILGFLVNFLINLNYLKKFIKLKFEFDKEIWKNILKISWPIAITSIFSLIYFKADTLFLSILPVNPAYALSNEAAVGIYGAPYKILEVLIAFPAIFMGLVSPLLAKAWVLQCHPERSEAKSKDPEKNTSITGSFPLTFFQKVRGQDKFNLIFQKTFDTLSIIIWPLIIGVLVLAKPLIVLVAGSQFAVSAPVFQILIWAAAIIFITHLTTYSIIAIGKQKKMIKFYLVAATLAVAGYIFLIPRYSYFAAAWTTVGIEFFMLISTIFILKKYSCIKINLKIFGKAMLASVIMGFILNWLRDFNVVLLVVLGGMIYFGILVLIKGVDRRFIVAGSVL